MDIDDWARDKIKNIELREQTRDRTLKPLEHDLLTLEYNFARALLLLQSMVEICHRKGVFTREELGAVAAEIDQLDGKRDGMLDPAQVPGMESPTRQQTVERFLHELGLDIPPDEPVPIDIHR